ncbi:MAG: pyridoxal phosphate-dependent aminotransferase [Candidatus Micrarchaeota archaeon]|nr:pyridoxal phosphate-dependent aminotransferase [Candidatus Micrarchaeota archaeon]
MKLADRMSLMGTETAFEVLAMAKGLEAQGKKIMHFEIGEPDFDTPQNIKDAACKALKDNQTHYTPACGIADLRQAIAEHISKDRRVEVKPEEVVVLPGAKPAIYGAITTLVNPGEEVIIPNPSFPIYESVVNFVGAKPVLLPLDEEKDFRFDISDLEKMVTKKTKMICINSPHNPCGSILTKKDIQGICEIVKRHNLWLVSDEVYSKLIYNDEHASPLSEPGMKERTIMIDGFSKTYAMTGWRLGYAIAPKELVDMMTRIGINIWSCPVSFVQKAAIEALRGPQDFVEKSRKEYIRRMEYIHGALNGIDGVSCRKPRGAFYAFPNVKSFGMPAKDVMTHLLNDAGVACLHGSAFGKYGEGYLRFSYATSLENLQKGMPLVKESLEKLKK